MEDVNISRQIRNHFHIFSGMAVFFVLVLMMGCKSEKKKMELRLDDFASSVTASIDFGELRVWADDLIIKMATNENHDQYADMLPSLLAFNTNTVPGIVADEYAVQIWWRTEYGIKSIVVGSSNSILVKHLGAFRQELSSGIIIDCHSGE